MRYGTGENEILDEANRPWNESQPPALLDGLRRWWVVGREMTWRTILDSVLQHSEFVFIFMFSLITQ